MMFGMLVDATFSIVAMVIATPETADSMGLSTD